MGQFYDLIMEPLNGSFSYHFNERWSSLWWQWF